jgi:hypothetical protein
LLGPIFPKRFFFYPSQRIGSQFDHSKTLAVIFLGFTGKKNFKVCQYKIFLEKTKILAKKIILENNPASVGQNHLMLALRQ